MRFIILLFILNFLSSISLYSQQNIQWLKELNIYSGQNGFLDVEQTQDDQLAIVTTGVINWPHLKSYLFKLNTSGVITFRDSIEPANAAQIFSGRLYSTASQLSVRNLDGSLISKKPLIWFGNQSFYAMGATMLKNCLYAMEQHEYVVKYDVEANEIWTQNVVQIPNTSCTNYLIRSSSEHVFVYSAFNGAVQGGILTKLDTLGNIVWRVSVGSVSNMRVDAAGNIYVMNWNMIFKVSPDGTLLWQRQFSDLRLKDCYLFHNQLYVCGSAIQDETAPGFTEDDYKCGLGMISAETGEVYFTQFFDIFRGECSGEEFSTLLKTDEALYVGVSKCGYSPKLYLSKFTDNTTASIKQTQSSSPLLNIFPNPTGRTFMLSYKGEAQPLKVEAKKALGQIVFSKNIESLSENISESIDLGQQPKGIYFIEVSGPKIQEKRKLVIE